MLKYCQANALRYGSVHEMSIATEIINGAIEVARQNGATRIDEVEVEIGVMRQVMPEALELAFSLATKDTLAEGAQLIMTEEKSRAQCCDCEYQFELDQYNFMCPQCQRANVRIVAGNNIILKSLTCQTEEEAPVQ